VVKANQADDGFTFNFTPCVDASQYAALTFEARGTPFTLEAFVITASGAGTAVKIPIQDVWAANCIPIDIGSAAVQQIRFQYASSTTDYTVELYVDNLSFSTGSCTIF